MAIRILYVDLFCGAGGTSTGVERARLQRQKCAKVISCVNHDANAIASHAENHPHALHFTEDIRTLELGPLKAHIERERRRYPKAKVVLWASLECTNHSRAKGGTSRDADSRTLAEHLYRYIEVLQPDYIHIENVVEFMEWGPLIIQVKRDPKTGAESSATKNAASYPSARYGFPSQIKRASIIAAGFSRSANTVTNSSTACSTRPTLGPTLPGCGTSDNSHGPSCLWRGRSKRTRKTRPLTFSPKV